MHALLNYYFHLERDRMRNVQNKPSKAEHAEVYSKLRLCKVMGETYPCLLPCFIGSSAGFSCFSCLVYSNSLLHGLVCRVYPKFVFPLYSFFSNSLVTFCLCCHQSYFVGDVLLGFFSCYEDGNKECLGQDFRLKIRVHFMVHPCQRRTPKQLISHFLVRR